MRTISKDGLRALRTARPVVAACDADFTAFIVMMTALGKLLHFCAPI
jgi:hypothetical protein